METLTKTAFGVSALPGETLVNSPDTVVASRRLKGICVYALLKHSLSCGQHNSIYIVSQKVQESQGDGNFSTTTVILGR